MADSAPTPTTTYEALLDVPTEPAWALLKDFGNWATWWSVYSSTKSTNTTQGLGAARDTVLARGSTYHEEVIEFDDATYSIKYTSKSTGSPVYGITHIQLTNLNAAQTKIAWNSFVAGAQLPPEALATIAENQKADYILGAKAIIMHLVGAQMVQNGTALLNGHIMTWALALQRGEQKVWAYGDYAAEYGPLPRLAKELPPSEIIQPHKVGDFLGRFLEFAYGQLDQLMDEPGKESGNLDYKAETLTVVENAFGLSETRRNLAKRLTEKYTEDEEFCQQLLQGVNPMHIKVATSTANIPETLTSLKTTAGESVEDLINQKRLFILDYRDLEDGTSYAPVMLVYREILSPAESRLSVLGIVLNESSKDVYTPQTPFKNRYLYAKMIVASADNEIHQSKYHLGLAHFSMEPVIIAVHNAFPEGHVIKDLLTPHFDETLGMNLLLRGQDEKSMKLVSKQWSEYDFFGTNFPGHLKSRGFDEKGTDGVQNYLFRDDGFKIWNAFGKYVTDVVDNFYKTDADVANDKVIQGWAHEMSAKELAAIPGFPTTITTRELLAEVLQTIVWHGSGLHSALHYPQWPYLGYLPNKATKLFSPMPAEDGKDIDEQYIKNSLGPQTKMISQMSTFWIFTVPSDNHLCNVQAMKNHYPEADQKLNENMKKISEQINERNRKLEEQGKAPYLFLLPHNVASSINS